MGPASTLGEVNEGMLVNWIKGMAVRGFPIVKSDLQASVAHIVREMRIDNHFTEGRPGRKWMELFLRRHSDIVPRTSEKLTRNRAALTREAIECWFSEVKQHLEETGHYRILNDANRIFNMDESGFMLCPKGEKVLGIKGQKNVYDICGADKENVTVLFGVSADGAKAPSLIVYSGKRLPKGADKAMPDGWALSKSEKGWITGEVFFEYIANVFHPWLIENNIKLPIILFLDGHKSHLTLHLSTFCDQSGIIIVALKPNATHVIQPLDVSVFGPLKKKWAKAVHSWKLANKVLAVNKLEVPKLLDHILFEELDKTTITNGFKRCGLFPFDSSAVDYSKCSTSGIDMEEVTQSQTVSDDGHKYLEFLLTEKLVTAFKNNNRQIIEGNIQLHELWCKSLKHTTGSLNTEDDNSGGLNSTTNSEAVADTDFRNVTPPVLPPSEADIGPLPCTSKSPSVIDEQSPSTSGTHRTPTKLAKVLSPESGGLNVPTPFKNNLFWPETPKKNTTRRQLKLPAVVTSEKWRAFEQERRNKKEESEKLKAERKAIREQKKQAKISNAPSRKRKSYDSDSNSSLDEVHLLSEGEGEDWGKGESSDEVESNGEDDASELTVNDFILVKFTLKSRIRFFIGLVEEVFLTECSVKFLRRERKSQYFVYPLVEDIRLVSNDEVVSRIHIKEAGKTARCMNKFVVPSRVLQKYPGLE